MIRLLLAIACLWPLALPATAQEPASQVSQGLEKARQSLDRQDPASALAEIDAARARLAEQMALPPGQIAEQRQTWERTQIQRRRWYARRWVGPVAALYLLALLAGIFRGLRQVQRIDSGRAA